MILYLSTISRDFFIVFDKELQKKSELLFNVNFFYLKSYNEKKKVISYINEPFFRGQVEFGLDFKEKLRPLRFWKITKEGKTTPIDPRLFKKFLIDAKNKFVAFSNQTSLKKFDAIIKMLNNLQFEKSKIIQLTFCKKCLQEKKFNILNPPFQIKSFKNVILCPDCALETVINNAIRNGVIKDTSINPKLKEFFRHLVLKFKDITKVLSIFKVEFDPSKFREATLYDVEKNPPISSKYYNIKIDNINIPKELKSILKKSKINILLPIQAISIEKGLLSEHKNQLIMAPTSAGKTLIGELAGLTRIIKEKLKVLYLVPIVALANVRTEEFKRKYKDLNIKIIKKVGESILEFREDNDLEELKKADLIIATYEAIDYILRNGNMEVLGKIGTIIIDEIQTLTDPERGYLLDGFIARLKSINLNAQFLYLSATIGSPEELAKKLNCLLIKYKNRPVPIERHLIICQNEKIKHKYISQLVRSSFSQKSKFGYRGQSIIFTNSRKKCETLAIYLQKKNIRVKAYHSGLTNDERKEIELLFQNQEISAVVATSALAAGVDFPAKQVIFESLGMGIKILTVAEFEQMIGRAGRLKKHESGVAYLLVEPGKIYTPKLKQTEENIAVSLLNGKIKDYQLEPDEDKSLTELLAFISMFDQGITHERIYDFYDKLINGSYNLDLFLKKLIKLKLITFLENRSYLITGLGRSVAKSFLTINTCLEIISKLKDKSKSILEIVLNLKPLKNVYLSKKIVADLSKNISMRYFSNNFFSSSVLSLMNANNIKKRKKFSESFIDLVYKWTTDIFNCNCKDNPYCECGRFNLEKLILRLRTEEQLSIEEISNFLLNEYELVVYKGDIIDYLENLIYSFESIYNISKGVPNLDASYKDEIKEIPKLIEQIKLIQ